MVILHLFLVALMPNVFFFSFVRCNALSALNVDLVLRAFCAGAFGGVAENDGRLKKS